MGRIVEQEALAKAHDLVARINLAHGSEGVTSEALCDVDVAIEFSVHSAIIQNIRELARAGLDAVIDSTRWHAEPGRTTTATENAWTGLIYEPNFSLSW
ncbi:MAG: hypothetical protein VYD78_01130 [Gemmatimonadota bacterium]|nr:hypothetical protein [Gemmatimonadota bacterium]